jgi:Lamin Tail Domain
MTGPKTLLLYCLCLACVFPAISQDRYSIIIDEIMADPSPAVALPAYEWIELKNVSTVPIDLHGWRIVDGSGTSGPFPIHELAPDSFVIVCGINAFAAMNFYGAAIAVSSFPSLDNDGELLYLIAANGRIIHAANYSSAWYGNKLKEEGGWSLEMIDINSPCSGKINWTASIDNSGGTPGRGNAAAASNEDTSPPQLLSAFTTDSMTIILVFDEPVDSLNAAHLDNYTIEGGPGIVSALPLPALYNQVLLKTDSPLSAEKVYSMMARGLTDCRGNKMAGADKTRTGIPSDPSAMEWIINEILFDPRPNTGDYIECYNISPKIFDASRLFIANRNGGGAIGSIKPLGTAPHYVFPGDYLVLTEEPDHLFSNYLVKFPLAILPISSLPSFPDDEGYVILLNNQGQILDEVHYRDDWHFALLNNKEGVSLERISPGNASQDKNNWHSAASTAGFGTPGYKNSQSIEQQAGVAMIEISPAIFSPDNDGLDDIATIRCRLKEPGYVANIIIFDAAGRPVRRLVSNGLLGIADYWVWDGLNDKQQRLPSGIYIVFGELFNLQGKKQVFKKTIVLAGR